jgi:hypothetical protein
MPVGQTIPRIRVEKFAEDLPKMPMITPDRVPQRLEGG